MIKVIFTFLSVIVLSLSAKADSPDSLYLVTYSLGPSWDESKNPGEQAYFKEHSSRLGQLRKEGIIKFGARYADKGMTIITAPTMVAAKDIISKDPGIVNKLFVADIQKLSIFYDGCLERPK